MVLSNLNEISVIQTLCEHRISGSSFEFCRDCNLFIINADDRFGSEMFCSDISMKRHVPSLLSSHHTR